MYMDVSIKDQQASALVGTQKRTKEGLKEGKGIPSPNVILSKPV